MLSMLVPHYEEGNNNFLPRRPSRGCHQRPARSDSKSRIFLRVAGPTGYGVYRALERAGIACEVIAPSLVPIKAGDKVKTDRRDACKLARSHRAGELTPIHVPDEVTEAMRDLERARDDAKRAEKAVRNQLGKFLLRHDRKYDGKTPWTQTNRDWIRRQTFEHEAQNRVLQDYLHAVEEAGERVARLTKDIEELVESWSSAALVKALQALGASPTNSVVYSSSP